MALVRKQTEPLKSNRRIDWNCLMRAALEEGVGQYIIEDREQVAEHRARRAAKTVREKFQVETGIRRDSPNNEWTAWFEITQSDIPRLEKAFEEDKQEEVSPDE